jgi:hypothetical protein
MSDKTVKVQKDTEEKRCKKMYRELSFSVPSIAH